MRLIGMAERALQLMCDRAIARKTFGKRVVQHVSGERKGGGEWRKGGWTGWDGGKEGGKEELRGNGGGEDGWGGMEERRVKGRVEGEWGRRGWTGWDGGKEGERRKRWVRGGRHRNWGGRNGRVWM